MFEGAARGARAEHNRAMQAAWTVVWLGKLKKLPPVKDLLIGAETRPKKQRPWQDLLKSVESYARRAGTIAEPKGGA